MTAAVQFLSAIENGGYFEADCSLDNPLRDKLIDPPIRIAADGTISPSEKPGIGVDVDEDMILHFPERGTVFRMTLSEAQLTPAKHGRRGCWIAPTGFRMQNSIATTHVARRSSLQASIQAGFYGYQNTLVYYSRRGTMLW